MKMAVDFVNPLLSNNYRIMPGLVTMGHTTHANPLLPVAQEKPSFGSLLSEAMEGPVGETISTDAAVQAASLGLISGLDSQDVHDITLASSKADIMLNLTVQIRNRMVEGYQEIMRMQI